MSKKTAPASQAKVFGKMTTLHATLAESHYKLRRGIVWCHTCDAFQRVSPSECFATGWPKCCEQTMSIDSPEERMSEL